MSDRQLQKDVDLVVCVSVCRRLLVVSSHRLTDTAQGDPDEGRAT